MSRVGGGSVAFSWELVKKDVLADVLALNEST